MKSVSIADVAAHADVSIGTVSNALNHPEKLAESTRQRVQSAITELGFVRHDAARQLRGGSKTIALVVLDVRNPFFTDLARGAEDKAWEHGLSIILANSDRNLVREAWYLDLFEEQRLHGVLISPFRDLAPRLQQMRKRGIPAVLVDQASADKSFSSVAVDDVAGGRMAAEHLISLGRRRLMFVGGPLEISQVSDRLRGAQEAVATHPGVTMEIIPARAQSVAEGRHVGTQILQRDKGSRPDGVFAANDLTALGILQALTHESHLRVPGDIAIVGYDDIEMASISNPSLSSVRQPRELIGHTAVEILIEEAKNRNLAPRHVAFQPDLIVRATSGVGTQ